MSDLIRENIIGIRCCANFDANKCVCPRCASSIERQVRHGRKTKLICANKCGWEFACSDVGHAIKPNTPSIKIK